MNIRFGVVEFLLTALLLASLLFTLMSIAYTHYSSRTVEENRLATLSIANFQTGRAGAGVIINDYWMLSAAHVIVNMTASNSTFGRYDEKEFAAKPVEVIANVTEDIALVKFDSPLGIRPAAIDCKTPKSMTDVYSIGHPHSHMWWIIKGTVVSDFAGHGKYAHPRRYQTDIRTMQGNSGGGSFTMKNGKLNGLLLSTFTHSTVRDSDAPEVLKQYTGITHVYKPESLCDFMDRHEVKYNGKR